MHPSWLEVLGYNVWVNWGGRGGAPIQKAFNHYRRDSNAAPFHSNKLNWRNCFKIRHAFGQVKNNSSQLCWDKGIIPHYWTMHWGIIVRSKNENAMLLSHPLRTSPMHNSGIDNWPVIVWNKSETKWPQSAVDNGIHQNLGVKHGPGRTEIGNTQSSQKWFIRTLVKLLSFVSGYIWMTGKGMTQ